MKLSHPIQLLFLVCLMLSGAWYVISASTGLLLIIAAAVACRIIFTRQTFQVYNLTNLMLAYLAWLLVVTFTSTVPNTSMMMLSILAGMPIIYLVASNLPNFAALWQQLRLIIFGIAVGFALMAIWQVMRHSLANGPLTDRNAFAALLNLIWFPAVFLLVSAPIASKRRQAIFLGFGLFIISLALFATTSRAGLLTWAILLPFMLWAIYKHTNSKKQIIVVLVISALACVCSAQFLHSSIADRSFQIGPSAKAGQMSNDASVEARLLMWQSTIKMAQAHPFTGTGWDTFRAYYPAYRSPLEYTTTGRYAHNDYLQFAAEGGFIAVLLLLGLALVVMLQLRKCLQHKIDTNYFEAVALLLGVLAIFIQASANFIFCFSFINLVAGLFLARVANLTQTPKTVYLPAIQIKPSIKKIVATCIIAFLSFPYLSNVVTQVCLIPPKLGLQALHLLNTNITSYQVARFITLLRPQESLAQITVLNNEFNTLHNNIDAIGNTAAQLKLINSTLNRYDYVRAKNALNPELGVQQVRLLILHHNLIDSQYRTTGYAFAKASQILTENLKMRPLHTDSMAMQGRLEAAEGKPKLALQTLQDYLLKVQFHIDQQLIFIEILRIRAAPKVYTELNDLEVKLHTLTNNYQNNIVSTLPSKNFFIDVDTQLGQINQQIKRDLLSGD